MKHTLYYILSVAMGLFILNACDDETETPAAESQQVMTFDIHLQANNCQGEPLANGYMLLTDARYIQYAYKMDDSGTVLADYPDDQHLLFPLTYTLYDQGFSNTKEEAPLTATADEHFEAIGESVCGIFEWDYLQMSFGEEHFLFDDLYIETLFLSSEEIFRINFSNWVDTPPAGLGLHQQNGGLQIRNFIGVGSYPMLIPDMNGGSNNSHASVGFLYGVFNEGGSGTEVAYSSPMDGVNNTPDASLELTKIPDANGPDFQGHFSGEAGTYLNNPELNTIDYSPTTVSGSFRGTPQ